MAKKPSGKIEQAAEVVEDTAAEATAQATDAATQAAESVKAKFGKALEEAKAGASALGKDLQEKAAPYRDKLNDKLANTDFSAEAKALGEQARIRALALAADGKVKASDAIASLGKVVADNASLVDDKLGAKYGDYARTAARALQETAARIEAKDLEELGKEAGDFVKKNPAIAVGAAAAVGFVLARMLGGESSDEA